MTSIDKNSRKVDKAWKSLYNRLEEDGLFNDSPEVAKQPLFGPVVLKLAAVFVILLSATLYIYIDYFSTPSQVVTFANNEKSTTFVATLEDGSVVYLAENASISYQKNFQKNRREVILTGDAFFEVSKNKERPFIIQTDLIKIEVLGTSFNVRSGNYASPSLSVNTGKVKVTLKKGGQTAKLNAGETVLIGSNSLKTISTLDVRQFSRYTEKMHFKDQKLVDVIKIINRKLKGNQIEISPELNERLLTATFSEKESVSMASLICIALNLKYSQQKDVIKIHE